MSAFIGAGIVSVSVFDPATAFDAIADWRDVGNVSALSLDVQEERLELKNFRVAAGGVYASVARVENATLQMDFRDFTPANFAQALWGSSSTAGGNTTVEALIAAAPLLSIRFVGVNIVNGKAVTGKFHKVRLGAPSNVAFIGEDFGTLQVAGTMEADTTIVAVGASQYFQLVFAD